MSAIEKTFVELLPHRNLRSSRSDAIALPAVADDWDERQLVESLLRLLPRDAQKVREIVADLEASMFGDDSAGIIFDAIRQAIENPKPDIADVVSSLRRDGVRDGDEAYIRFTDLLNSGICSDFAAERHAREAATAVVVAHNRRCAVKAAEAVLAADGHPDDAAELVEALKTASEGAMQSAIRIEPAASIIDCLDRWRRNESPPRVPTGFSPIDRHLGGGLPIGLTAIAAQPKVGKSCLAGQLMLGALLHDPKLSAVWFRGEMTEDQLLCKMLATWSELRHPIIEPITRRQAESRAATAAAAAVDMAEVTAGRFSIIAAPLTPSKIVSTVQILKPKLVVIDYLQKVQPDGGQSQRSDKRHEVEDTTARISAMALEYGISTVVIASLPKTATQESGIGTLAKDSNLLDYDVNVFATLWKQADDSTLFRINANRDGPEADEQLWFDGNAQFFRPAAAEIHEEFAPWAGGSA
jgi:replicative DNA helicase